VSTCPSIEADLATSLIGVAGPDGVAYLRPPVPVTPELLASLREDEPDLERRFRFAGTCLESGCGNWTGSRCSLSDGLAGTQAAVDLGAPLPHCGVRGDCRWWAQHGARACAVCPLVVTNVPT
jgi:hypothetical protein